jgi:hypothetical protein
MCTQRRIDIHNVLYPGNRLMLFNKRNLILLLVITWMIIENITLNEKANHHIARVHLYEMSRKGKSLVRKQNGVCPRLGMEI